MEKVAVFNVAAQQTQYKHTLKEPVKELLSTDQKQERIYIEHNPLAYKLAEALMLSEVPKSTKKTLHKMLLTIDDFGIMRHKRISKYDKRDYDMLSLSINNLVNENILQKLSIGEARKFKLDSENYRYFVINPEYYLAKAHAVHRSLFIKLIAA